MTHWFSFVLFCSSLLLLVYVYQGYLWLLRLLFVKQRAEPQGYTKLALPSVTLLLTVYNEEKHIEAKLLNMLALDYPSKKLQILVASDGSTDQTEALVTAFDEPRICLFRPAKPIGKTDTQNKAIASAEGEILVFTDAETLFEPGFLKHLVIPYCDPQVGGVGGHLLFRHVSDCGISQNQGFYWAYELKLRLLESRLGLLAVASGACMSIRRKLFQPMISAYGEDCIVPLSIVDQGYRYVQNPEAVATDRMASTEQGEFRTRVRMTLRNWQGTWSYPRLLNPLRHPGYAFALWSHKLLRWSSPFLLLALTFSAVVLAFHWPLFALVCYGLLSFYAMALLGWWAERAGFHLPLAHTAYSFVLANLGFLVGVCRALGGHRVTRYKGH